MPNGKAKGRQRNSSAHSKKGCATCKMRRVKCGEEKPECERCLKSGWQCDRYEGALSKSNSPAPTRPQDTISISTYNPSVMPRGVLDEDEQRYFQVYLDQESTSFEVQDSNELSWRQVVLQESQTNLCVRHGLIAIGAVARSAHTRLKWAYITDVLDSTQEAHRRFALIQYQKAIRGLRTFIDGLKRGRGCRSTLISCMVLTLFDCLFGNVGFAAQHIRFGRKLLSSWMSTESNDNHSARIMDDPIDCHLIRLFVSVDIQATSFLDVDKEYTYPDSLRSYLCESVVPKKDQTLEEARAMTRQVLFDGCNIYLNTLQYKSSLPEDIPQPLIYLREYYLSQLHLWDIFLQRFAQGEQLSDDVHPLSRGCDLRLRTTILLINLSFALNASETKYDSFLEHFEYLLSASRDVIDFEAQNGRFPSGASFESYTFEPRIVPALYLVATRCGQPSFRREAIQLLKSSHRREGLWDSLLASKVAEWVMELEEYQLEDIDDMEGYRYELKDRRVVVETIELDVQGRNAIVRCRQVAEDGGSIRKSTAISW